jgi:hypothetical protein
LPQQNNGKTMVLHAVATHSKYGIQRPPWQRHELSSVISLSFLDVYGRGIAFLIFVSYREGGLLNKSSCLAAALGVTKFIPAIAISFVTLCCAA